MQKKPNVLVILADQMRGQAMGCAGDPNVDTPNLDRLAAEGVRFSAACSTYPICVPFRFTMMTGEHAHTRHVPGLAYRMSPAERTIAHEFNDAGYETSYVGKWHLYGNHPDNLPGTKWRDIRVPDAYRGGFRDWHGFEIANDYFDTWVQHGSGEPKQLEKYQTDGLTDIAMQRLDELSVGENPFFMVLSVEPPHNPYEAPAALMEKYRKKDLVYRDNVMFRPDSEWEWISKQCCAWKADDMSLMPEDEAKVHVKECLAGYYAQIENLDQNVGRLLARLEALGIAGDTDVVFVSDHGDMHNSHGFFNKQFPFEESINIPLIVRSARQGIEGGRVIDEPVCTEDLFPTLLGLAGITVRTEKPGLDLVPVMRDEVSELARKGVYLEFVAELRSAMPFFQAPWRGFRTGRYKYILLRGEPFALYDLERDPYEMKNLIKDEEHAEIRDALHADLISYANESGDAIY